MKKYLLTLLIINFFVNFKIIIAYELDIMSIHNSKTMSTNSLYKFTISEAEGNWQDSMGNYGKARILFYLEQEIKNQPFIKGLGKLNDQNNNVISFIPMRQSFEKAGVGRIQFIESSNSYEFLLQSKCTYAINYFENRSFMKVKCK